jgi:peroxiredoxin Q/BCP
MGTIRSTFVVDDKGMIARVFPSVKVDGHDEAVLAAVKEIVAAAKPKASGAR